MNRPKQLMDNNKERRMRRPSVTSHSSNNNKKKSHKEPTTSPFKDAKEPTATKQRSNSITRGNTNQSDHKRSSNKQYASQRRANNPAHYNSKKKHPQTPIDMPAKNVKQKKKTRLVPMTIPLEQEPDHQWKDDGGGNQVSDHGMDRYEEVDEEPRERNARKREGSLFYDGSHFANVFVACLPGLEPIVMAQLESILLEDTDELLSRVEEMAGGVQVTHVSVSELHQFHLQLGCASHILIRLISSSLEQSSSLYATQFKELHDKVARYIPWHKVLLTTTSPLSSLDDWFPQLDISVTAHKSKLHHTNAIAERIETAIQKSLRRQFQLDHPDNHADHSTLSIRRPNNSIPTTKETATTLDVPPRNSVRLVVRMNRNKCEISLDTSMTPLHRRGYKLATAKAPLREDLAFGLLYRTWWNESYHKIQHKQPQDDPPHNNDHASTTTTTTRLLDPFCGSGTIAIEAAAMLAGLPPGRLRPAPLEGTVWYNPTEWNQLVTNSIQNSNTYSNHGLTKPMIGASDRDPGAMVAAKANAKRAGVYNWIDFQHCALKSQPWLMGHKNKHNKNNNSDNKIVSEDDESKEEEESPLWIVTNPPYGKRIRGSSNSTSSLLPLYQTLGHSIRHLNQNVEVALYTQDVTLARRTGIPNIHPIFTAPHGGLRVTAMSTTSGNTIHTNNGVDEDDDEALTTIV